MLYSRVARYVVQNLLSTFCYGYIGLVLRELKPMHLEGINLGKAALGQESSLKSQKDVGRGSGYIIIMPLFSSVACPSKSSPAARF